METLAQRAALATTLLAGCAAQQLPRVEEPKPEPTQSTPLPISSVCQKMVGRLWADLDPESSTRCAEDNSDKGARFYELSGACNGAMLDPAVQKILDELARAQESCFFLDEAAKIRAGQQQTQEEGQKEPVTQAPRVQHGVPVVTETCERTLNEIDSALEGNISICTRDNSREGPRFALLRLNCERGLAIDWKSSRAWVPQRVLDMVDSLDRADLFCRQTDPTYLERFGRKPQQKPQ